MFLFAYFFLTIIKTTGFNVDDLLVDLHYYFDKSTKRKAELAGKHTHAGQAAYMHGSIELTLTSSVPPMIMNNLHSFVMLPTEKPSTTSVSDG